MQNSQEDTQEIGHFLYVSSIHTNLTEHLQNEFGPVWQTHSQASVQIAMYSSIERGIVSTHAGDTQSAAMPQASDTVTHACACEMCFLPVVLGVFIKPLMLRQSRSAAQFLHRQIWPALSPPWARPWSLSLKEESPARCKPVRSVITFECSEDSLESGSWWKPERLCFCG